MSVAELDSYRNTRTSSQPRFRLVSGSAVPAENPHEPSWGSRPGQPALHVVPDLPYEVAAPHEHGRTAQRTLAQRNAVQHAASDPIAYGLVWAIRAAIAIAAMLALAVIGLAIGSLFPITGSNSWTVQSGDTLWSIAADIPGAPDTTTAIVDLRELNNLSSDYLHVGQVIKLPKYE